MNAVVTLTIGPEFERMAAVTQPNLKRYADKIGAEFVVIADRDIRYQAGHVGYEKLQCYDLLYKYDRIIYLDTDLLVSLKCPNLFDIVPYDAFGTFQEGKVLGNGAWALKKAKKDWGIDLIDRVSEFFNAGVMVFSRSHQQVFTPPEVFHDNFFENTWLCMQVMRHTKGFDIGPLFNTMGSLPEWKDRLTNSYIIHYAGRDKSQLFKDVKEYL